MTAIFDLNLVQDLNDDDIIPIGTIGKSTRGVTANDAAKYFTSEIGPIVDEAKQAALDAQQSAGSAEESAAEATAAAGVVGPQAREALRRSYAEAGYPLIGDFSGTGLVVSSVNDVVLWEPTGIAYAYSGTLPHTITGGEEPVGNPLWVSRADELLRDELAAPDGSKSVGFHYPLPGTTAMSVWDRLQETLTPQAFMTPSQLADWKSGTGLVDQTSALNAFWQAIKASFVDLSSEDYVKLSCTIPAGEYRVDGYVNWTGLKARNTHILAYGAVFVGRGQLGAIVDHIGTRWVQVHGLTIVGNETDMPETGLLIGPENTTTNGNNMFVGVTVTGFFKKTAVWNIGSETTTYFRCRFVNYNTDKTAYAYVADGKMRNGATSQHQPLRAFGVAVSFTNNQFYSCDLRNMGGGAPVWAEFTRGWGFDRGCYFVSFDDAIFKLYTTSDSAHQNLSIEGLMESVTLPNFPLPGYIGCRHQIEFIGDGTASTVKGLTFKVGVPHTALASIKISSAGAVAINNIDLSIGNQLTPGVPVFDAPNLSLIGVINADNGSELNIHQIAKFDGTITVSAGALNRPVAGAYTLINAQSGQLILGGSGPRTFDGVYRTDGVAIDVDAKLRAKGLGNVVLGSEGGKLDAFTVVIPDGAVHSIDAVNVTTGTPYIAPRSSVAVVNMGVKSKGAGSRVQLSNDIATDSFVEVLSTSAHPTMRAAGVNTDIDLILAGKGTGNVRFGSLITNADAPITGYITVKDAGGVLRKLAVIS